MEHPSEPEDQEDQQNEAKPPRNIPDINPFRRRFINFIASLLAGVGTFGLLLSMTGAEFLYRNLGLCCLLLGASLWLKEHIRTQGLFKQIPRAMDVLALGIFWRTTALPFAFELFRLVIILSTLTVALEGFAEWQRERSSNSDRDE